MKYSARAIEDRNRPADGRRGIPAITSTLITGAASGIGRAVALRLAHAGHTLYLGDLDDLNLAQVASQCRVAGALVHDRRIDVTDSTAMVDWIHAAGRIDLVIASAGLQCTSLEGPPENAEQTRRIFEVNLMGVMNTVLPAMEKMERQTLDAEDLRGRIAVLSSLAAFVSVPGAPVYCASKAAVDAWAVGHASSARRRGIQITSVCPGYVHTPMTAINHFPMSGLMQPDEAARVILGGIAAGRLRLAFPWRMALAARIGAMMPAGSAAWFIDRRTRKARYDASAAEPLET